MRGLDPVHLLGSGQQIRHHPYGMELVIKAHLGGFKVSEVPTSWSDRAAGQSNFQRRRWLPKYLKWYFFCLKNTWVPADKTYP